jgi:dihydroorotase
MNTTLIRSASIIDPNSQHHGSVKDLLIQDGIIVKIGQIAPEDHNQVVSHPGLTVFPGFIDGQAFLGEPGFEDVETLESGLATAARGGFTGIFSLPNTSPAVQDKTGIEYQIRSAAGQPCSLYPLGLLLKDNGLAPLLEMDEAGAIAFYNPEKSIQDASLLIRGLEYSQHTGKRIFSFPLDHSVSPYGQMHEGVMSTQLGMKGIPSLAETVQIQRDLSLLSYAGGSLHIPTISTLGAVELIRTAKEQGLDVTCSVDIHHLIFCDEDLSGFDTNFKLSPPLRGLEDRQALINGVIEGTIDHIVSNHQPVNFDQKYCEFGLAQPGALGLQTAILLSLELFEMNVVCRAWSSGVRKAFGLQMAQIEEGRPAELSLIALNRPSVFKHSDQLSISSNSPLFDRTFQHTVAGIINNNKSIIYV